MFNRYLAICAFLLMVVTAAAAQVPLVNAHGATLEELAGTDTYVTVILSKPRVARDRNLRITRISDDNIGFIHADGTHTAHPIANIQEIRVQDNFIKVRRRDFLRSGALSAEDQDVVDQASDQTFEILDQSSSDQNAKMKAASLMVVANHDMANQARQYFQRLLESNDIGTKVEASIYQFLVGNEVDSGIVLGGMESGSRQVRARAAQLAGLVGDPEFGRRLNELMQIPTDDLFPSAARASGWVKQDEAVPELIDALGSLSAAKAEAAVYALRQIGGPDVQQPLLDRLNRATGNEWFRIVRVLYNLGDAKANEIMKEECFRSPVFAAQAALILGRDGDWDALMWLKDSFDKPSDPNLENLTYQAKAAAVLYSHDFLEAKTELQRLLGLDPSNIWALNRSDDEEYKQNTVHQVQLVVLREATRIGTRGLLLVVKPFFESVDPWVALASCDAALAIANPDYRSRLLHYWGVAGLID